VSNLTDFLFGFCIYCWNSGLGMVTVQDAGPFDFFLPLCFFRIDIREGTGRDC